MPLKTRVRPSEITGVVLDIDGTLLEPTETLELKKYRAHDHLLHFLNRLPPRKARFTFATGRAYAGIRDILVQVMKLRAFQPPQKLKHRSMPVILYNGSLIVSSDGRRLYRKWEFDQRSSQNILRVALDHSLCPLIYCVNSRFLQGLAEDVFSISRQDDEKRLTFDLNGLPIKYIEESMVSQIPDAVAILLYDALRLTLSERRRILAEINNSAQANVFGDRIEVSPRNADKGVALVSLAQILDWELNRIMVVGDSITDEAMIRVAGIGIALANSPDDLKEKADYVTKFSYGRGVEEALLNCVIKSKWKAKSICKT